MKVCCWVTHSMCLLWQTQQTETLPQVPWTTQAWGNHFPAQNSLPALCCPRSSPSPLAGPCSPSFSFILALSLTIPLHSLSPHQPTSHTHPPEVTKCSFPSQVSTLLLGLLLLSGTPRSRPLLSLPVILQVSKPSLLCQGSSPSVPTPSAGFQGTLWPADSDRLIFLHVWPPHRMEALWRQ